MNQEILLLVAVFLTSLLGIIIGVVAYSYRQLIKKFYLLKEERDQRLQAAQAEAQKIIDQASLISDSIKQTQNQAYQTIVNTVQSESDKILQNISKDVADQTSQQVQTALASLQQQIKQDLQSVENEIKTYQKNMHDRVDQSIYKILSAISLDVLGKTLSTKDHEDLIIDSLTQAKKENLF